MKEYKTILALLVGFAVGAGFGLFIAPERGAELRGDLSGIFKRSRNDLLNIFKHNGKVSAKETTMAKVQDSVDDEGYSEF